ncbi:hypothetical protein DT019_02815 [Streptomyces sp. SDr-06]|uniref:hypothetical protein n=1 Tax=Streptomyces sp. SDr-06 TaxID=2267702 RepID=UPI000DE8DCFC|nr:hypothetical protein [Streptomyces sp. SDr-06]RCH70434.1 hypothetical protein DT019_02815 [Streptomyces sp. SDr-06]
MPELKPGEFTAIFAKLSEEGRIRGRIALEPLAAAVEKQAKINASSGRHAYGTRTPARPGSGPAIISGTLRRSITHSPIVQVGTGWETKVGTGVGFTPPYGRRPTPANKYGLYLETGLRNGAVYPFLAPAFHFAVKIAAATIYTEAYGAGWTRVA